MNFLILFLKKRKIPSNLKGTILEKIMKKIVMLKIKDNFTNKIKIDDSSIQIFLSLISKKNKKVVYFTKKSRRLN